MVKVASKPEFRLLVRPISSRRSLEPLRVVFQGFIDLILFWMNLVDEVNRVLIELPSIVDECPHDIFGRLHTRLMTTHTGDTRLHNSIELTRVLHDEGRCLIDTNRLSSISCQGFRRRRTISSPICRPRSWKRTSSNWTRRALPWKII